MAGPIIALSVMAVLFIVFIIIAMTAEHIENSRDEAIKNAKPGTDKGYFFVHLNTVRWYSHSRKMNNRFIELYLPPKVSFILNQILDDVTCENNDYIAGLWEKLIIIDKLNGIVDDNNGDKEAVGALNDYINTQMEPYASDARARIDAAETARKNDMRDEISKAINDS